MSASVNKWTPARAAEPAGPRVRRDQSQSVQTARAAQVDKIVEAHRLDSRHHEGGLPRPARQPLSVVAAILRIVTTEAQSIELRALTHRIVDELELIDGRLTPGAIGFLPHTEHAGRARDVSSFLAASLVLVDQRLFTQAFPLLRTALECWAVDAVILVGDRYVQEVRCDSRDAAETILARWRDGVFTDISDEPDVVESKKGNVTVRLVRQGLRSDGDDQAILHPLYFEADRYDPFFGGPDEQDGYADSDLFATSEDLALNHRQRHNTWLRWKSLVGSLTINNIIPDRHVVHLAVHYRFLSAFVHGHRAAIRATTPGWHVDEETEHVVAELAVGYACIIGARYLDAFLAMADRPPTGGIDCRDELASLTTRALRATEHLWFLTDTPQPYDLGQELLGRAGAAKAFIGADASSVDTAEIRYYREPLQRLRGMHESNTEFVTGFTHRSPYR